jgi:hypothetical protein
MKLSAKTGVTLTITALSLVVTGAAHPAYHVEEDPLIYLRQLPVVTVGAGASASAYHVEEDPLVYLRQLPAYPAHVGMMNQLRNLTEANAIKWGWSQGLANDQASAGMTQYSGGAS